MKVEEKYPELYQFFGGAFHQDWNCDFASPEDVIRNYIKESHRIWVEQAIQELEILLKEKNTKAEWYRIISDDFGCEYSLRLRNLDPVEWLKKILKQLEEELPLAKND